jgi:hypothetical protein
MPEDSHSPRDLDLVIRRSSGTSRQQELAYPAVHIEHLPKYNSDKKINLHVYSFPHCEQKREGSISGEMELCFKFQEFNY